MCVSIIKSVVLGDVPPSPATAPAPASWPGSWKIVVL